MKIEDVKSAKEKRFFEFSMFIVFESLHKSNFFVAINVKTFSFFFLF